MKSAKTPTLNWCEVVRVDAPRFVGDRAQSGCDEAAGDVPTAAGYYLALWPAGASRVAPGSRVRYIGPLRTMAEVRLLQTSAYAMGIVARDAIGVRTPVAVPRQPSFWSNRTPRETPRYAP